MWGGIFHLGLLLCSSNWISSYDKWVWQWESACLWGGRVGGINCREVWFLQTKPSKSLVCDLPHCYLTWPLCIGCLLPAPLKAKLCLPKKADLSYVYSELWVYELLLFLQFHVSYWTITFICANSDYLFKLLLIGDSGVGKSCLLLRFAVSSMHLPYFCPLPLELELC